jgi:hypothetical protein
VAICFVEIKKEEGPVRDIVMFLRGAPFQGQWRLWWGRPGPALQGLQEAPPVVIAGRNGRAGRRDSGHGEMRPDLECISFEPREERNPAEATESTEKGRPRRPQSGDAATEAEMESGMEGAKQWLDLAWSLTRRFACALSPKENRQPSHWKWAEKAVASFGPPPQSGGAANLWMQFPVSREHSAELSPLLN